MLAVKIRKIYIWQMKQNIWQTMMAAFNLLMEIPQSHVVIDCSHNNCDLSMENNSDAHTETDEYHVRTDDADDNIQTPAHAIPNDAEHMIRHTNKHNIRNNLVCTICNRQYKDKQSLHRHITRDHPEIQLSGQIKCQEESCADIYINYENI